MRWNVLTLVFMSYVVLGVLYFAMIQGQTGTDAAANAYEIIRDPLMVIIGGSLAIAKDLVRSDDSGKAPDDTGRKKDLDNPPGKDKPGVP